MLAAKPAAPWEDPKAFMVYEEVVVIRPMKLMLHKKLAIMHMIYAFVNIFSDVSAKIVSLSVYR